MITSNKVAIMGAAVLLSVASCTPSQQKQREDAGITADSTIDATTKAKISTADIDMDGAEKSFILAAHSQSLYVTELTTIAAKSKHKQLQTFSKKIAADYQKMSTDVEKIAKGKGILLERKLSDTQQKELDAIKELSSPTLDQQVLQKIQMFQASFTTLFKEAQNLSNTDIQNFAKNGLSAIHGQQEETTKLVNESNETGSQSTRPGEVSIK
ncbi:DUF4142 domain-containing protein [Pedobacter ureilyticus]|jgi:predicted outer membrane protein|uniref:DUF4142 domain-containing protein n=1 Tax=Pedobacter ureilyticus TaxID=1393051 RepID=A0ABW9J8L1_9SPHI|nr:DUF4142 domain-containing protein [Pedobacter helvus]